MADARFDPLAAEDNDSEAMRLLKQHGRDARAGMQHALKLAKRHEKVHYGLGVPAALAVVPSLALAVTDLLPKAAPFILAALAACAALWSFFGASRKADIHYGRFDCLREVASRAENRAIRRVDPTTDELDTISGATLGCADAARRSVQQQQSGQPPVSAV